MQSSKDTWIPFSITIRIRCSPGTEINIFDAYCHISSLLWTRFARSFHGCPSCFASQLLQPCTGCLVLLMFALLGALCGVHFHSIPLAWLQLKLKLNEPNRARLFRRHGRPVARRDEGRGLKDGRHGCSHGPRIHKVVKRLSVGIYVSPVDNSTFSA